jgi:hypothetical protein
MLLCKSCRNCFSSEKGSASFGTNSTGTLKALHSDRQKLWNHSAGEAGEKFVKRQPQKRNFTNFAQDGSRPIDRQQNTTTK